jgi:hypothetical protein
MNRSGSTARLSTRRSSAVSCLTQLRLGCAARPGPGMSGKAGGSTYSPASSGARVDTHR